MDNDVSKLTVPHLDTGISRRQAAKLLVGGTFGLATIAVSSQPAAAASVVRRKTLGGHSHDRSDGNGTFTQIPGALTVVSAGSKTNVWGCNSAGSIFTYTQDDAAPWVQVPGSLRTVSAAADGSVWGCNSAGEIYRYNIA